MASSWWTSLGEVRGEEGEKGDMEGSGEERDREVPSDDEKNLRFDLDFLRVVGAIVSKSSCEYLGVESKNLPEREATSGKCSPIS